MTMAVPKPPQGPRLFTLEEANQLLPQVKKILAFLRKTRDEIQKIESQIAVEELSWLKEDGTVSERAQEEISRLQELIEAKTKGFEKEIGQLNALGGQLKDLDEGLIDFFTARERTIVCLCWKDGEDQIHFWHDMESGFSGRQPLEGM